MHDNYYYGPHGVDGPVTHDCDGHVHPMYDYPDVYHPTHYGEEWRGNECLHVDGVHLCPPRDFGRHGCVPEPCGHIVEPIGIPMQLVNMMTDYVDVLGKYMHATTYHEKCDCEKELHEIKAKVKTMLEEYDAYACRLQNSFTDLDQKFKYYVGRFNDVITDLENNILEQEDLKKSFDELNETVEEYKELVDEAGLRIVDTDHLEDGAVTEDKLSEDVKAKLNDEDDDTTYRLSKSGNTISLTGSDGSITSVTDGFATYTLSKEGSDIILTGSDGTTSSVTDDDTEFTLEDGSVTSAKLGSSAVTNAKINNGAVSEEKLAAAVQAKLNATIPEATSADILSIFS